MKKILSTFLFVLSLDLIYSQENSGSPITYTEVIKVDSNVSSKELYIRARTWFAETYRSAKDVIQMDDKESGILVGKGNFKYTSSVFMGSEGTKGWVRYTITISVKDGRYKYEITNFNHEGNPLNSGGDFSFGLLTTSEECPYKVGSMSSKGWRDKVWKDIKQKLGSYAESIITALKNAMTKAITKSGDDW